MLKFSPLGGCFLIKLKIIIKKRFGAQISLTDDSLENLTLRVSKFMTLSIKIKSVLWQ